MNEINSLNISLEESVKDINELLEELTERTEYLCTGEACGAHANLI